MWGNTVGEAATAYTKHCTKEMASLSALTRLLERVLKADLKDAMLALIQKLQNIAALTKDVFHLMDALFPLVSVLRYGSTRQLDLVIVEDVIEAIIPRICIGLPNACVGVDEDVSAQVFKKLIHTNQAINLLNNDAYINTWLTTLLQISNMQPVNGLLKGACVRILMDKKHFEVRDIAQRMRYALSAANDRQQAVFWMEGFLHGSGLLLIHNLVLWQILDDWVNELEMDDLMDILPLLRRTFSKFSDSERQKMMELAKRDPNQLLTETTSRISEEVEQERAARVLPTVRLLLGK